ncbi:uncharacterized protein BJ171DRAFT_493958 [Polychytrium aggregatum]|uniref:uncharacterized protein n=1 Tax=Polychytrium aggregatum TaxID=110093 RepID=UPI0022FE74B2|nr:uncharacterized protein BJ171DRAFT_493958 [Polychytrium aggregatum]KAI9207230.1 hypothetical protein BJ171DRAFT_493958 [Polychytrium aggregatum]
MPASGQPPSRLPDGPGYDLYVAAGSQSDLEAAEALKALLTATAVRRHQRPATIFSVPSLADGAGSWAEALPRCRAFVIMISQESVDIMKQKAERGESDDFFNQIKAVLDLKNTLWQLPVLPLAVASKGTKDGQDAIISFKPHLLFIPNHPRCEPLKQVLHRLRQIQVCDYRADLAYRIVYRILGHCFKPPSPGPNALDVIDAQPLSMLVQSTYRVNTLHLEHLLRHLTLTGRAVISGVAGIGKSALARQFLGLTMGGQVNQKSVQLTSLQREIKGDSTLYSLFVWLDCSTEWTLLDSLICFFPKINPNIVVRYACSYFSQNTGYILVLDNVSNMTVVDSAFSGCAESGFHGDIVVTTRLSTLPEGPFLTALGAKLDNFKQCPLCIEPWETPITSAYLNGQGIKTLMIANPEQQQSIEAIAALLRGYPPAIEICSRLYENNNITLSEIEQRLKQIQTPTGPNQNDDFQSLLQVIVDLSISVLLKRSEGADAVRLVYAVSLLAPRDIPLDLINQIAKAMGLSKDGSTLIRAICECGMLSRSGTDLYSAHPLVQAAARCIAQNREDLRVSECQDAVGNVLMALVIVPDSADPLSNIYHDTVPPSLPLIVDPPKAKRFSLSGHLDEYISNVIPENYGQVWHHQFELRAARLSKDRQLYDKAKHYYQSSIRKGTKIHGNKAHSAILTGLLSLGDIEKFRGRLTEAAALYQEAIDLAAQIYGARPSESVSVLKHHLAVIASVEQRCEDSLRYYQESLEIVTKVLNTRIHSNVAHLLCHIGHILERLGRFDDAKSNLEEARETYIKLNGGKMPAQASETLTRLMSVSYHLDRFDDVQKYFQEALDLFLQIYWVEEHDKIAWLYKLMGLMHMNKKRYADALHFLKEALRIQLKIHKGGDESNIVSIKGFIDQADQCKKNEEESALWAKYRTFSDLAQAEFTAGRYPSALLNFQEVLRLAQQMRRPSAREIIGQAHSRIGLSILQQKRAEESLEHFQTAMDILTEYYGTREHTEIASIYGFMGSAAVARCRYEEALQHYGEAVSLYTRIDKTANRVEIAAKLSTIASIESHLRLPDAQRHFQESIDISESIHGTRVHPDVGEKLEHMGVALRAKDQLDEAYWCFEESLDIFTKCYGSREHYKISLLLRRLSSIDSLRGKYEKSLQLYREALAIITKCQTLSPEDIPSCHLHLGFALRCLGKIDEARIHLQSALDMLRALYGSQPSTTVACVLDEFAWLHHLAGEYDIALDYHQQALAIGELNGEHFKHATADFMRGCAEDLLYLKRYDEAAAHLHRARGMLDGFPADLEAPMILRAFGDLHSALGEENNAIIFYIESIEAVTVTIKSRIHPIVARCLCGLARIDASNQRYDVACERLSEAIDIFTTSTPDHPYLLMAKEQLDAVELEFAISLSMSTESKVNSEGIDMGMIRVVESTRNEAANASGGQGSDQGKVDECTNGGQQASASTAAENDPLGDPVAHNDDHERVDQAS